MEKKRNGLFGQSDIIQQTTGNPESLNRKAQRVPQKLDPRKHIPRHITVTLPKVKDKERILKAAREKDSYLQRSSHKTIS